METIILRLLENKNKEYLSTSIFRWMTSEEKDDFRWIIDKILDSVLESYNDDIRSFKSQIAEGLSIDGPDIEGIFYEVDLYEFDDYHGKTIPLDEESIADIKSKLSNAIMLPPEDEEYRYSVEFKFISRRYTTLEIYFRRDRK